MTVYQMRTRKFADDADRRAHWAAVYANHDFVAGFATAPWGPHPCASRSRFDLFRAL